MSKKTAKQCIVVDASIARAAGAPDTVHPLGMACRLFLKALHDVCHRMAWGPRTRDEWAKHQSAAAALWLTAMNNLGKLVPVEDAPAEELLELIEGPDIQADITAIMRKDAHLLAAAARLDSRIASLDDKVRLHFSQRLRSRADVMGIVWVNPGDEGEDALVWLQAGAKADNLRRLARYEGAGWR